MKKKIIIFIAGIVIACMAGIGGYFLYFNHQPAASNENANYGPDIKKTENQLNKNSPLEPEISATDRELQKTGYRALLPAGWAEANLPEGVSFFARNESENVSDPAALKLNFKTYYAISQKKLEGQTLKKFTENIKEIAGQMAPGLAFSEEKEITLNGFKTIKLTGSVLMQEVDFMVVMAIIQAKNDDVYMISFNCAKDKWEENQTIVEKILNQFKIN